MMARANVPAAMDRQFCGSTLEPFTATRAKLRNTGAKGALHCDSKLLILRFG